MGGRAFEVRLGGEPVLIDADDHVLAPVDPRLLGGGGLLDPLGVVGLVIDIDDQAGPGHRDILSFQNDRTPELKFGP